ncbi:asparagine--tRNA ligase [Buchnera aphidicola (Ceratoglyphina bambusae)]|uniref:asparagine--tRNA ligase n=1 Tax=Buchnera aphidicola TaxID=9 RepID=UPI0031B87F17
MNVFSIKDIYSNKVKINSIINIFGWIKSKRDSKIGISFIDIFDGSCIHNLQIIAKSNLKNYYLEIIKLNSGCSVHVNGILILSKKGNQKYELLLKKIKVFGIIKDPDTYPISLKKHTFEYLRSFAHLRPRTKFFNSISRIRNSLFHGLNNFLIKNDFFWVPTPIITGLNTEGSGSMFNVCIKNDNYICKKNNSFSNAFLTVSGQLTLETYSSALSKVYTFGPIFRAENSNTTRHLSEFWMLEVEASFLNLKKIISIAKFILRHSIKYVIKKCALDIEFLEKYLNKNIFYNLDNILELSFIEIEYKDAIKILNRNKKNICFGQDISSDQEKYIVNKYFNKPVIIKNFPKKLKAFYMRNNDDDVTVASMDVFLPGIGEVIGGSQREERLHILDKKFNEFGLSKRKYWWYRDLRKYGTVLHSGFGIGFERLLCYITGLENIKDASPFPRTMNKFSF